jgi:electron transfer flavoprotein alpha subunit
VTANVFILAEHLDGRLTDATFELLALGRELATGLGAQLQAVLLAAKTDALAADLGAADGVLAVEHDSLAEMTPDGYAHALEALLRDRKPRALLVPGTNQCLGLTAMLSVSLDTPCANWCRSLKAEQGAVTAVCTLYGGKMEAEVKLPAECALVSVAPGAAQADKGRATRAVPVEKWPMPAPPSPKVKYLKTLPPAPGDIDITQCEVLVSVGRGIGGQENLGQARELAELLGGALSASRPLVDQGWLPATRQVGKSGMIVKPRLYLALGISGAPEHVEGMRGAKLVVAVNTDPKAPIFDVAKVGAELDLLDFLPALTEEVRKRKGN